MLRSSSPLHLHVTACPYGFIILHQPFVPGCCLMGTLLLHYKRSQRETTVENINITSLQCVAPKMRHTHNPYNKSLTFDSDGTWNTANHNVILSALFTEESKPDIQQSPFVYRLILRLILLCFLLGSFPHFSTATPRKLLSLSLSRCLDWWHQSFPDRPGCMPNRCRPG